MTCPHCGLESDDEPRSICPFCLRPWPRPRKRPLITYGPLPGEKRWRVHRQPGDVEFQARCPAKTQRCARCGEPATTWHHWLTQEAIRVHVRTLMRDVPASQARRLLRRLLRDERNLTAYCAGCHADGEAKAGSRPFTYDEVPGSAFRFAAELGARAVARLERTYPTNPL
jgi:hypothetical protein